MNIQALLDQILRSANAGPGKTELGKYATGAAAGGALALLLGSKRARKLGGKALKYGSVAAVGALAWNAYRDWQAQQAGQAGQAGAAPAWGAPAAAPAAFAALPPPAQEDRSWAMLRAMIAAAKSDGHLDERERELVEAEVRRLDGDATLRARVDAELRRPVEPAEVASGVAGLDQAAEVYLASLIVCDTTGTMERAYLDALASALQLPPPLKADLERRATAD